MHFQPANHIVLAIAVLLLMACAVPATACWQEAAQRYGVDAALLYAIARTESGLNEGALNHNANGSTDIGLMQINSSWLPRLQRYGIDAVALMDPCTNIHVGAWVLAQNLRALGANWEAVGAYNAHSSHKRIAYAWKVYRNLQSSSTAAVKR
jgi:soluble lytic murein transglycosylase-like protein